MNRVSNLQQANISRKGLNDERKFLKGNCCHFFLWILIGILTGAIPFAIILTFHLKGSTESRSTISNSIPILRWSKTGVTIAGVSGQLGNASNRLNQPWGLYIDWSNSLYIADQGNHRIQKYPSDASVGETVAGDASARHGNLSNFLNGPMDVAVDLNGNIYVADVQNHRVQLWSRGALSGATIAGVTGLPNNTLSQLRNPYGIAHDPNKNIIYVSDTGNNRVLSYRIGVNNGMIVAGGNGPGSNGNQLHWPYGMHFDDVTNSLIIATVNGNNIVRWTLGAPRWTLIAGDPNGASGSTSDRLYSPTDVILDPMGNVYVTDVVNGRVQFFSAGESNGTTIAGITGVMGINASVFQYPSSVALDSQLNLYVSDCSNHRVQKFTRY